MPQQLSRRRSLSQVFPAIPRSAASGERAPRRFAQTSAPEGFGDLAMLRRVAQAAASPDDLAVPELDLVVVVHNGDTAQQREENVKP